MQLIKVRKLSSQRGVSLVELMVGIAISLILLTGIISVMLRIGVAGGESVQATRLNQQLRGAMDTMTRELQRAGYVNAWTGDDINDDGVVDIRDIDLEGMKQFGFIDISADGDCILYSYDSDGNGAQGTAAPSFELFGFRLNNGAVEMKTSGAHACNSNGWARITDDAVAISQLIFTIDYVAESGVDSNATVYRMFGDPNDPAAVVMETDLDDCIADVTDLRDDASGGIGQKCLARRKITIELAGNLAADPNVTLALTNEVKVKNDHFIAIPD